MRIAVLAHRMPIQGQRVLGALYRRASFMPSVVVRHFDPLQANFQNLDARPLLDWQPHGVVLRMTEYTLLARWRKLLADVPMVTTFVLPDGLADTSVVVDIAEAVRMARDHFLSRGITEMALFCSGEDSLAHTRIDPFREIVPSGHVFGMPLMEIRGISGLPASMRKKITDWLESLPKPVGILTLENFAGPRLMSLCQEIGLHVPNDVQLIGVDDLDYCLACNPHLTNLDLPSERIGEVALDTLLRHVRKEQPPPPQVVKVAGSTLIARGSTGLAAVGSGKIAAAVRAIQSDVGKRLSAARIVKQSQVGQTTFYKQFRETTGTTPARQLRETRLKKACEMLAGTDASITDIATACGFSGGNYFARFFRHATGQTPSDYREQQRGGSRS